MAKSKDELKDWTIVRFDRKRAAKVELDLGRITVVLERSADGTDWAMTKPQAAPAQVWKVDNLVRVFGRLKAKRFHTQSASPGDLKEWMLDPPSRRLRFYDAGGTLLGDVRLGNIYQEGEVFALRTGEKRVGIIEDGVIKILPTNAQDLIDTDRMKK